jgi:hypothetical protein
MREAKSSIAPETAPVAAPATGIATVFGWLCIVFAIIPLALGVQAGSGPYLEAGGGLAALGVVLIVVGRWRSRHRPPAAAA